VDFVLDQRSVILEGFWTTLRLTALSGLLSFLIGTALAVLRVCPIPPLRWAAGLYVTLLRNTPLTLVFVFSTFGLPRLDIRLSFFTFAVVALTAYTSAFVCEAVRAGVNSVPLGQAEASRAIGFTFTQSMTTVVLPQALRAVVPPLASVLIALAKNTSVAAAFGLAEATFRMRGFTNDNADARTQIFILFAVGYIIIVEILSAGASGLERRWGAAR
jgi:glutamate transport system permease protein